MANSRDRWARFLELAETPAPVSGLVAFRVLFGLMAFWSAARFELNGWVEQVFGGPRFFFHYWGFSVIEPMSVGSMHVLFGVMLVSSALITVGLAYRAATVVYFLSFTYVELSASALARIDPPSLSRIDPRRDRDHVIGDRAP
jgi:hypothetical protein